MPTRRLAAGFTAAARIASPSFVCWKISQRTPTTTSRTATSPSDSTLVAIPPTDTASSGNTLGKPRLVEPQIQRARPLTRMNSPSVTVTSVSSGEPSTGRISARSITMPPSRLSTSVISTASRTGTPASTRPQATNVLNIAISPWAKLTIPVER